MNFQTPHWSGFALVLFLLCSFSSCVKDTKTEQDGQAAKVDPASLDFKRTDNTVYVNLPQEPRSLNPLMTTQGYSRFVHRHILQTLNEIDPDSYAVVPMLAGLPDIFERTDGGVDYTFDILETAKWSDGMPITAADVVFSLKLLFNPLVPETGPYRSYYQMIDDVTLSPGNAKRIKIGTDKPYILSEAALGSLTIYPEYAYDPEGLLAKIRITDLLDPAAAKRLGETNEELKTFTEQFVDPAYAREADKVTGSGPYKLVSWDAGQKIRLEKNDNYWADGSDKPWLANEPDAIEYQFVKDQVTVANALRDQEFDVVAEPEVSRFRELKEEAQTAQYYDFNSARGFTYYSLMFNMEDPVVGDVNVRRALARLIDVDQIMESNYGELATRVTNPILPQKSYYNDKLTPVPFDVEGASKMLSDVGWEDSNANGTLDKVIDGELTELKIELLAFTTDVSKDIALRMQQSAKAAGVDIEVVTQDGRTLYDNLNKGSFQLATMGAGGEPIPDDLTQVWSTRSVPPNGGNRMRYGDSSSDRLIDQIRYTMNVEKRDALYLQLQERIYNDQPMIFLFAPYGRIITSKRFKADYSSLSPGFRANTFKQRDWNKKQ